MTASSQFDELELDRSRFGLRHKGDNFRLVGNPFFSGVMSHLPVIQEFLESIHTSRLAWPSNRKGHPSSRCPVLRVGEKGGYDDGIHKGRCKTDDTCASIAARRCQKT